MISRIIFQRVIWPRCEVRIAHNAVNVLLTFVTARRYGVIYNEINDLHVSGVYGRAMALWVALWPQLLEFIINFLLISIKYNGYRIFNP